MRHLQGLYKTARNKRKKFDIYIPCSWEELSAGSFGTAIYMLRVTTNADPEYIKISLLALLFERHFNILEGLTDEESHYLKDELTEFFYTEEPPVKNFYPKLNIASGTLYPCAEDLSNIGFGEWCFLDTYFSYFMRSNGDWKWLERMIAVVYRLRDPEADKDSADYTGDIRQRFNENLVPARAEQLSLLHEKEKMAIFQWLCTALKQAKEDRPYVFPKPPVQLDENGSPVPAEQAEDPAEESGWMNIFNSLIGPKFGPPEQLKHTNAFLVLDHLNQEQKQWEEYRAKTG